MKINITAFVLFIFWAINLTALDNEGLSDAYTTDTPYLKVSEKVWDFGKINQGEQKDHVFILQNIGTADLIIKKIKSTCGCTVAKVAKKNLKPNESTKLTATFNSLGRKGKQLKKIYITTNNPLQRLTILAVKGFIKTTPGPEISVTPKRWDFGLVKPGTAPHRTFVIKNNGVKDLLISKIRTSSGCHAEMLSDKPIRPSEESVMNVILDKLHITGLVEDFIRITSNDTSTPVVHIRVNGYVKGLKSQNLKILSDRIDLGVIDIADTAQPAHFEVPLFNVGDKPLRIKNVESPKRFIKKFKTPFTIASKKSESIGFEIRDNKYSGTFKNIIIIHSNDSNVQKLKITLFGYLKR